MEKNTLNPIAENRNLLSMWGTGAIQTSLETPPVVRRNYFAIPGLIKEPAKPVPYRREPGQMIRPQFAAELILEQVTRELGITCKQLQGNRRKLHIVDARCIVIWLCNKYAFISSMRTISRLIKRDRTTGIYMVERANNAIETNNELFIEKLQRAEKRLLNL